MTNKNREWFMMYPPETTSDDAMGHGHGINSTLDNAGFKGTKTMGEAKRLAGDVPLFGNLKKREIL